MNKITLVGRLTKNPELNFLQNNGTAVCKFILAVNRKYKKEGYPEADFIPIVIWGKMAESTAQYKTKGELIGISGRIETRTYDANDGTKRYVTEVIAEDVEFLSSSKGEQKTTTPATGVTEVQDEEIPF